MPRLSYPTETVLSNKITRNRIVLSFKDSPRNPLGRRPKGGTLVWTGISRFGRKARMHRIEKRMVHTTPSLPLFRPFRPWKRYKSVGFPGLTAATVTGQCTQQCKLIFKRLREYRLQFLWLSVRVSRNLLEINLQLSSEYVGGRPMATATTPVSEESQKYTKDSIWHFAIDPSLFTRRGRRKMQEKLTGLLSWGNFFPQRVRPLLDISV